jgi:hypothetical protein
MNAGLKKLLGDGRKHRTRLKRWLSSDIKELTRARSRLSNFESLAQTKWGEYFSGRVKSERLTMRRLQNSITRWKSSLARIEKSISTLQAKG